MKISVIVTSYNYEQYIRRTLDSLVQQTYKDFDVIIVDDGSKDNSVNIIKEFTNEYPNFKLYMHPNNENRGLVESVKLGISKSNADYIAFLESDDYWAKEYLEEKVSYIKQHENTQIIINDIQPVGNSDANEYIQNQTNYYKENSTKQNHFDNFYEDNGIGTFSEVMIKTDTLKQLDFNTPVQPWLDWWLWRQVAIIYPIVLIDKKMTFWNRHQDSYLSSDSQKDTYNRSEFKKLSNKLLLKKYPIRYISFKLKRGLNKLLHNIF